MKLLKTLTLSMALALGTAYAAPHELTVAQSGDPGSWDPIDTFMVAWVSAGASLFDGLVLRDENLQI